MTPQSTLQMCSTVRDDGTVRVELVEVPLAPAKDNEVVVRMEAAPINPSDLGTMLAGADIDTAKKMAGTVGPALQLSLSAGAMGAAQARLSQAIPLGNEGAGVVVAAGKDPSAQALIGRTVALRTGSYSQYRTIAADFCLVLPKGTAPTQAASCFVNPLTALGMVDTMRAEGHQGLVHTAAASNLGQMLVRICVADDVPLVNIVRSPAQVELLRGLGASHVVDASSAGFQNELTEALAATHATVGFDATGGGTLASTLLAAMEGAQSAGAEYSRYGSTVHKQVYLYGSLQLGPTQLTRTYGMAWGVGGWLLTHFLNKAGRKRSTELMERVAAEIGSTFASHYTKVISLTEALQVETAKQYVKKATGEKYLVAPQQ